MACTTCNTKDATTLASSPDWKGTLLYGAEKTFIYNKGSQAVYAVRAPNIVVFNDNPYLEIGDKFLLENVATAKSAGIKAITECQTVTVAPTLVSGKWEVATDDTIVSLTGSPTVTFSTTAGSSGGIFGCATTATTASKVLAAVFCDGTASASNFTGYIYTRQPNALPVGGAAIVVSGSNKIQLKARTNLSISKGDKVEVSQTALVGASSATITDIIRGRDAKNEVVTVLTLSVPVTGITAAAVSGVICVDIVVTPQAIAPITFSVSCGCAVTMRVSSSITSAASFPIGLPYQGDSGGNCGQSQYCYTVRDNTPNSEMPFFTGTLVL